MSVLQDFGEVKRKRALLFPHFFKRMLKEAASYGMFGVGGFFGAITAFFLYASLASYTSPLPVPVASEPAYLGVSDVRLDELRSAVRALEGQVAALKPSEYVVSTDLSLATGNNLIRNSSFETAEGGKPRQWTYTLDATSSNTYQTEEAIRTGDYGLKFKGVGAGSGKAYGISQPETQTVAGRTYTFSAYVKHTNLNAPATLRIGFWDKSNNRYAIMKDIPVHGTQDWYRVSTTVTTTGHPSDDANWYPMLEVRKLPAGGAVYLDDVQLEEGSLLTVYSSAQAAAGSSGSANALGDGSILSSVYGDLYPAQSGVGSLGTTTNRWQSLHLSGADIDQDGNLTASGSISSSQDISASGAMTANGNLIVHGTATFNSPIGINGLTTFTEGINVGSATITNFAGDGLTVSSGVLSVNLATGSGFTFAAGKLSLLRNCAANEVLAWNGTQWTCASISGVGGITKIGSPVAGYVTYWSGTSAITGNSALYYDGANLGIGKTNPGFSLDVNGIINATALYVNGSPYIGSQWTTSGSNIYYTSGNVGIGTSSPSTKLHIVGDMRVTGAFYDSSNSAGSSGLVLTSTGTGTTWSSLATLGIVSGTGIDNYLARFNSAGTGIENGTLVDNAINGISLNIDSLNNVGIGGTAASTLPRLYVAANGNVGIGTTSPGAKLDIAVGNLDLDNTTNASQFGVISKNTARFLHDFNYGNNATVTTDGFNTFVGLNAGNFSMGSTATAVHHASYNTAVGYQTLLANTTGFYNSSLGYQTLLSNTTGTQNNAIGWKALANNTTGNLNNTVGVEALRLNISGNDNNAFGYRALYSNTTGRNNIAIGTSSLYSNTTGIYNTAVGSEALYSNTTANSNTALGFWAGKSISNGSANQTSSNSLYLGYDTRPLANGDTNEIVIGYNSIGIGSNTITLGNDSIVTTALKGNVGIGTTSPLAKLDVAGTGWLRGSTASSGGLFVNSSGNVGIGTTSPAKKVEIVFSDNDRLQLNQTAASTDFGIRFAVNGARKWDFYNNGADNSLNWYNDTIGNNALYMNQSGQVGILAASSPGAQFHVNSGSASRIVQIIRGAVSQTADLLQVQNSSNTNLFVINSSGNVGIGITSPSTQLHTTGGVRFANFGAGTLQTDVNGNLSVSSDARLKTVQQPFGSSLEKLVKLSGVVYKWNELSGLDTTHDYVGFLAQDVEAQFPGLVGTSPNGYKSLNYAGLTVPIIEAMKEQQGQIEALKLAGTINNAIPVVTTSQQINIASVSAQLADDDNFISLLVAHIQQFIFDTDALFSESVTFLKDVTFGGRIFFQDKDMGGFAVISKGTDQVAVKFIDPYKTEPVINITSKDHSVTGYITDASSTGFTIKITQNAEKDLLFNWTAIAVSDPTTTQDESDHILSPIVETTPTITPTPTSGANQPSPSVVPSQPVTATPSPTTISSQSPVASPSAVLQ